MNAPTTLSFPYSIKPATGIVPEVAELALPEDARVWVPQAPNVWFRPLLLNKTAGYWFNLLKVTRSGVLSRHRHPGPVHGYVIKGAWRYLEHPWVASAGKFVFEPPGETHTLVVDADTDEMITLFNVTGSMIYMDEHHHQIGYEDVFTKIDMCRAHYEKVGLGAGYVEQFIR
jgi:2,4'-dihydroxyacetophenone dioxygenase